MVAASISTLKVDYGHRILRFKREFRIMPSNVIKSYKNIVNLTFCFQGTVN